MLPTYVIRQAKKFKHLQEFCRTQNNRINRLHKKALSLVYNDFSSGFSEDKSVTIHYRNLQTLAYKIFKVKNNMAPKILTEIFPQKESNYNLRNSAAMQGGSIKTVMHGSETISSLGRKIWDILPTELKKCVYYAIQKENS